MENVNSEQSNSDISYLVESLLSETITAGEFECLCRLLENDSSAREFYIEQMSIEAALEGYLSRESTARVGFSPTKLIRDSDREVGLCGFRPICLVAVVASLAAVALTLAWSLGNASSDVQVVEAIENSTQEPLRRKGAILEDGTGRSLNLVEKSVGRITNGRGISWRSHPDLPVGSWLMPGRYELDKGKLEVTLDSGAVIYFAGETLFEIVHNNRVRLLRGALEASVPSQAIGFRVDTPTGEITDLSTKFGVKVEDSGASDIHVIKGLVEVKPFGKSGLVTVAENSAIRLSLDAPPESVEFSPTRLFGIGKRKNDAGLNFVHFSFDGLTTASGSLVNSGRGRHQRGGKIVDGIGENSWVPLPGVFGDAVYLSGQGAKVKTSIKGVDGSKPRTFMCWVRIAPAASIENAYSFASWGLPGESDGNRWQIGWNPNYVNGGEGVFGALRTEFGRGYVIGSTDLRDGRWHHIASVFLGGGEGDDVAQLVRHYVDGKLESVSGFRNNSIMTHSEERSLTVGEYIGSAKGVFSSFKGWIDEFYLFDKALTPPQIVQLMESNRPPADDEIVAQGN